MPVLRYLADTNSVSDFFRDGNPVKAWFMSHRGQVGISTLTLAEVRRGIELRPDGKEKKRLEAAYRFILQDYREAIFVFDEAAAVEFGKFAAQTRNCPVPYDDALIAAIARSSNLTIVTRNIRDFPGCATVNPWDATT